jgi:hypothetical protein
MKAALLFLAATASATPLGSFDIYTTLRGRADASEMTASLFPDIPEAAAYYRGRAAGLREAEQIVRYFRAIEISELPPGLIQP